MNKIEVGKINAKNLIPLLLAGVLLLLCTLPSRFGKNDTTVEAQKEDTVITGQVSVSTPVTVEERLVSVLSKIEGAGKVDTMIFFSDETEIEGIVVVAEGAKNAVVREYILNAVEALFGLPTHKIIVLPMQVKSGGE